jgi:hypothetical protein
MIIATTERAAAVAVPIAVLASQPMPQGSDDCGATATGGTVCARRRLRLERIGPPAEAERQARTFAMAYVGFGRRVRHDFRGCAPRRRCDPGRHGYSRCQRRRGPACCPDQASCRRRSWKGSRGGGGARPGQNTMRLGHGGAAIWDPAETGRDDHRVEALAGELQRLRVADPQVRLAEMPAECTRRRTEPPRRVLFARGPPRPDCPPAGSSGDPLAC